MIGAMLIFNQTLRASLNIKTKPKLLLFDQEPPDGCSGDQLAHADLF